MKEIKTEGLILLTDDLNIKYKIAKISYTLYEDNSFEYVFYPYYEIIDIIPKNIFQGIPGLDLSKRKKQYIRKNTVPVFISERTPSDSREDLYVLLEEEKMSYLNQLDWLIKTDMKYSGDNFSVIRYTEAEKEIVLSDNELNVSSYNLSKTILKYICWGNNIKTDLFYIDDSNRKQYYDIFYLIYKNEINKRNENTRSGIEAAKRQGLYKGRKRISIDKARLYDVFRLYKTKVYTIEEAAKQLNTSLATTYRRFSEMKNDSSYLFNNPSLVINDNQLDYKKKKK